MAERRVTIRDVARHAGVSTGTVSAVINDRPTVREPTRRRVLEVIDRLGYTPMAAARSLGSTIFDPPGIDPGVGFVVKEMDNPFYAEVVIGATEAFDQAGYMTFVSSSGGDFSKEGELIETFRHRQMKGVIVAPVLHERVDLSHLFLLRRSGFPFTLLEHVQGLHAYVVSIDNVQASQTAAAHLIGLGHRRIVHLAGPSYTQHTRDRISGVERAYSQSPLQFSSECIVPAGAHFQDGYDAALKIFSKPSDERPTAVTCFNDVVAMGVLRAVTELGLSVPEDVSVVGFDDIPAAAYLSVPLTTVGAPKRHIGRLAAELLIRQMKGEHEEVEARHTVVEATLIERGSTRRLGGSF